MIHVGLSVYGIDWDMDGRLRGRIELTLFCDSCQNHVDLPEDASVTSIPVSALATVLRTHTARGCR